MYALSELHVALERCQEGTALNRNVEWFVGGIWSGRVTMGLCGFVSSSM
jgi:hypothetical protein